MSLHRNRLGRDGAQRLGRIDGVRELPLGRRRELAGLADEVTAATGETITRQREPGLEFMMLEEGTADVKRDGERIEVMHRVAGEEASR